MKTEEELKEIEKLQMKRARTTATVFGMLAITALILIVYAFFQSAAAEREKLEATFELEKCQKRVEEAEAQVVIANKKLEQMTVDALIEKEAKK
ncbi:MAG TPA: hypothetical protein PLR06_00495 [Cyclobacteriaceae bacterium]|nr:hypothetical protein [Cyclobacteriaceae bacterium]